MTTGDVQAWGAPTPADAGRRWAKVALVLCVIALVTGVVGLVVPTVRIYLHFKEGIAVARWGLTVDMPTPMFAASALLGVLLPAALLCALAALRRAQGRWAVVAFAEIILALLGLVSLVTLNLFGGSAALIAVL